MLMRSIECRYRTTVPKQDGRPWADQPSGFDNDHSSITWRHDGIVIGNSATIPDPVGALRFEKFKGWY